MFSIKFSFLLISANVIITFGEPPKKFFRPDYEKYMPETDSFYKIYTQHKTFDDAKETCELDGAELFYPEDEDEAKAVISYWQETQRFHWIIIGVYAPFVPDVFVTIHGASINTVYKKWGQAEPNSFEVLKTCVILRHTLSISDAVCNNLYPFICKKRASTIRWNRLCDLPNRSYKYVEQLGRCYKFHTNPRNWTEAFRACNAEQGYLAIIDSQGEADHLVNITKMAKKDDVEGNYLRGAIHLGYVKKNSVWRSIMGRPLKSLGYKTWGTNQPDGGDRENCGSMFFNGKLNDIGCNQKCLFICEREIPLLENSINLRFGDYDDVQ
ncbi:macrophage mannose receptor 1-like [Pieris napi]|uniref:macrophage mannose receptor 1-like n=1 Tax=Pieris napi TaxID=78633 RepID=UPI001FBB4191|nr:macrophage mannose receptor 1-like [Pieris napi]